jgi:hypothetical protein
MGEPTPATPASKYFAAAVAMIAGAFFFAVGAGLLPIAGGPSNLHGPLWLVLCAGLAFFLAGVAILIQLLGHANDSGYFPARTPLWLRAMQYLIGLGIFVCFGAISSWVAFGPGERHFSGTFMFGDASTNAAIGRVAFGTGAIIIWLCTAVCAAFGFRKLFGRPAPDVH